MIGTDRAARYRLVEMTAFRCRFFPVDGALPLGGGDALQGDSSMAEQHRVALGTGCGKPDGTGAAIARQRRAEGTGGRRCGAGKSGCVGSNSRVWRDYTIK